MHIKTLQDSPRPTLPSVTSREQLIQLRTDADNYLITSHNVMDIAKAEIFLIGETAQSKSLNGRFITTVGSSSPIELFVQGSSSHDEASLLQEKRITAAEVQISDWDVDTTTAQEDLRAQTKLINKLIDQHTTLSGLYALAGSPALCQSLLQRLEDINSVLKEQLPSDSNASFKKTLQRVETTGKKVIFLLDANQLRLHKQHIENMAETRKIVVLIPKR